MRQLALHAPASKAGQQQHKILQKARLNGAGKQGGGAELYCLQAAGQHRAAGCCTGCACDQYTLHMLLVLTRTCVATTRTSHSNPCSIPATQ